MGWGCQRRSFEKLERYLHHNKLTYKRYKVENDQLVAKIASRPISDDSDETESIELYTPFYKLTKLEIPDEEEANKLLDEQLEKELELSIMFKREQGLTTAEIDKMDVQELLKAVRKKK